MGGEEEEGDQEEGKRGRSGGKGGQEGAEVSRAWVDQTLGVCCGALAPVWGRGAHTRLEC